MDSTKYYTTQVELNEKKEGTNQNEVLEFLDMTWQQVEQFKGRAFVQGVQRQTAPGAWELIDPLRIHRIRFFQQPNKFNI